MGASHARAYAKIPDFRICGLVDRADTKATLAAKLGGGIALFDDYETALAQTKPDVVCIATYPDTHEPFTLKAFAAGAHVFVEKPVAPSVAAAERVVAAARAAKKKMVVGYILRQHPSWIEFIRIARTLGKPLVMRMNLNQQSSGSTWATHKNLLKGASPIVDCGVHYVDVMCQMTDARPISVSGIWAHLADDIPAETRNYGHLQVRFDDGSIGWYEAGWGPMMSETAFFVKDVIGPRGCVSIVAAKASSGKSDDIDAHSKTESLCIHHSDTGPDGKFTRQDEIVNMTDEPDHDELCRREQVYLLDAIRTDADLSAHWADAVSSLKIVLAADESARTGETVKLR